MATGGLSEDKTNNCLYGYHCTTKEETTQPDFLCISCGNILREPSLVSCCSQNFCANFLKDKKICPACGEELHSGTNWYLHKEIQKLLVLCAERTHGCDWEGDIRDLDEHTSLCEYVQVTCKECGQEMGKGQLTAHLAEECPKREYSCPHCGFKDTYSFVTNAHSPVCSDAPVKCPNSCGMAGERDSIDKHLEDECPLHYIVCSFKQAGCMQKFRRDDREKHMQASVGSHLASLADFTFQIYSKVEEWALEKLERENEDKEEEEGEANKMAEIATEKDRRKEMEVQKMEEDISDLRRTVDTLSERVHCLAQSITDEVSPHENVTESDTVERGFEKKLQEKEAKIQQLRMSLDDQINSQMRLEKRLATVEKTLNNQPQDAHSTIVVFKGYGASKEKKEQWVSPILNNDSANQHKLKLVVWPSGQREGKGTHVSVWLEQEVRDGEIPPAHIFVDFELLNQLGEVHHVQCQTNFPLTRKRYIGGISNQLVEHSKLEYDPLRGTQYLVEDSLKFRVRVNIKPIKAS